MDLCPPVSPPLFARRSLTFSLMAEFKALARKGLSPPKLARQYSRCVAGLEPMFL